MTQTQALTKTLVFPLDVQSGNESLLHDARLECRRVFNEVLRLNYDGWDWDKIEDVVEQNANLVQNTAQRIIDKASTHSTTTTITTTGADRGINTRRSHCG